MLVLPFGMVVKVLIISLIYCDKILFFLCFVFTYDYTMVFVFYLTADFHFLFKKKLIEAYIMVGQFIDTFWRKSFIGDLHRAKKVSEDDTLWTLTYAGKAHQFQFVWIQGICVKV
jgi:hypothetical protein